MSNGDRQAAANATRLHKAGKLEEAQKGYVAHLASQPDDAGIWSNLGALFRARNKHDQAYRAQKRAYDLHPNGSGIRGNFANILSDIGKYEESIALRKGILKDDPANLMQHAMIGRCYRGLGRYEDAIAYLEPRVFEFPQEPEIELQLAFAQLGAGEYGKAFRRYQSRWRCEELKPRSLDIPQWQTGDEIRGKTILILPEQGFGDAILFSRFVTILAEKGAEVHFLAEKPVARLFENLSGAAWVGTAARADGPYDFWMNLMDMPVVAYTESEKGAVPPPARLSVPEDSIARARSIAVPYADKFKVGVVWSGSATYKGNSFRSFTHQEFLPLTDIAGAQVFSLYKGPFLAEYTEDGSHAFIVDTGSTDRDFADCAATMQEMDLVITSDTATAHIAGSLSIPVWTVLHWDPFWVFGHDGDSTPWYPSMRLFRQKTPLVWVDVFAEIRSELGKEIEGKR